MPASCFAKAKPLWLRGGEFAGMRGELAKISSDLNR
jgi:hypothetical protein